MNLMIRPVVPADEDFLWQMLFYATHAHEDGSLTLADIQQHPTLAQYVADWGRAGDLGYIAEVDEQPVGAVWARILTGGYSPADGQMPELAIAVRPEYTGRGIGTQLMQHLITHAAGYYPALALNVRADNPVVRLYERLGFVVVGEMTNRVGTLSYDMRLTFV